MHIESYFMFGGVKKLFDFTPILIHCNQLKKKPLEIENHIEISLYFDI